MSDDACPIELCLSLFYDYLRDASPGAGPDVLDVVALAQTRLAALKAAQTARSMREILAPGARPKLEEAEAASRRLARIVDSEVPNGWGFGLLLFSYGDAGHITWISSANREDMARALHELLGRWEKNEPDV